MPQLTQTEQNALMSALGNSFGNCSCHVTLGGSIIHCSGHRFLGEVQKFGGELVDRVSILTYYRRMARLWTDAEFSRPFTTLEPELPPDLIPESRDHTRLPW